MSPKPILSENVLGPFSPPFLSSVPWPRGDQPQGTWTVLWAKLSLTGALETRKQLGVGVLCGPCSFRRAIPVLIELVPAKLPLSLVRKETSPQGQPLQGAGGHLPNSLLHFIPHVIPLPSWYTHVSLGMNSVGKPCLFTI